MKVEKSPTCFRNNGIILQKVFIREIDEVDSRFRNIESLDLSNNLIKQLGSVNQFLNLKTLNLSNNKVFFISNYLLD